MTSAEANESLLMIDILSLQKDYGAGKGVFNLSLHIPEGEVFGFLGPNGAGKTTTIRMLLGFIAPDAGQCHINGLPAFEQRASIMSDLGYLPAEINFFDGMNGMEFLTFMGKLHQLHDTYRRDELIRYLDIDTTVRISRMSKGMKQKIALVAAFMHRPRILILDEPTSGLDPLMQRKFNELITEERERGTTVFMSSHSFEEVERTCDRIGIIKQGHLVAVEHIESLHRSKQRRYTLTLARAADAESLLKNCPCTPVAREGNQLTVSVSSDINKFIQAIAHFELTDIRSENVSLEDLFMQYYK